MKCTQCNKDAEYVFCGSSLCAEHFNEKNPKLEEIDIHALILSIDEKAKTENLFNKNDKYSGGVGFLLAAIVIIVVSVVLIPTVNGLFLHTLGTDTVAFVSLVLSGIAAIFGYVSFVLQMGDENKVNARYKRAIGMKEFKEKSETDKTIIKALIMIRTKNRNLALDTLFSLNSAMFKEEKLFERVYK
jgi:hypothetical protein